MSAFAAKPRARPSLSPIQRKPAKAPTLGISTIRPSSPGLFQAVGPAIGLGPGGQRQDAPADIVSGSHSARPSARAEIQRALEQAGSAPTPRLPRDRQQI